MAEVSFAVAMMVGVAADTAAVALADSPVLADSPDYDAMVLMGHPDGVVATPDIDAEGVAVVVVTPVVVASTTYFPRICGELRIVARDAKSMPFGVVVVIVDLPSNA